MKHLYEQLNKKLESEILELQEQIKNYQELNEVSGGGVSVDGSGLDPAFNGQVGAWAQNRGFISGIQGGNSDAVIANPSIINKTAAELAGVQLGAFTFDQKPQKPILSNNIGLGMGLGYGDVEFSATRDFVNKYSQNYRMDPYQNLDPQELGYLSWKAVNDAVAIRDSQNLKSILNQWGLFSDVDNGSYPEPIQTLPQDTYTTQDPATAFAKKIKKEQEQIKEFTIPGVYKGKVVNKILNSKNKK
jgi:DNA-binding protein YbaB